MVLRDFLLSVTQSSASDSRVPQTVVNRTLDRRRRHGRDDAGTLGLGQAATELFAGFDPATAEGAFRLVFIGIAALTLPHMILVEVLERRERRTTQTMAY